MPKTSGHFKRCNVGSVEAHNERTQDYLDKVKAAGLPLYFFQELTANNTHWVNDRQEFAGKTCSQIFEWLKQLYTEKTGQAPQLKDRTRVNKKTGKEYTVSGWSPIREAVIVIKEDTTIDDFKPVFDWLRQNGLEPIRLDLHKDEGYKDQDTGEVKMNYHAHLTVCWVDLQTGKTANLKEDKMSEFNQEVLPAALGMERGEAKEVSGREHMDVPEYREYAEALEALKEETRKADLQVSKAKAAMGAAGVAIGQTVAGWFGQSEKDTTIKQLQEENKSLQTQLDRAETIISSERRNYIAEVEKMRQNAKKELISAMHGRDVRIEQLERRVEKEQSQTEAALRRANLFRSALFRLWKAAADAVKAIVERVNSSERDFTPEQTRRINAALSEGEDGNTEERRVERGRYLIDISRPQWERPDAWVEKDVEDIARNGTEQQRKRWFHR